MGDLSWAKTREMPTAAVIDAAPALPRTLSARRRVTLFNTLKLAIAILFHRASPVRWRVSIQQFALILRTGPCAFEARNHTDNSCRLEDDDEKEYHSHEQRPMLSEFGQRNAANDRTARRPAGNKIAQNHEDRRAQHRTVKRTGTSNDSHYDHLSRKSPEQQVGRDELD